MKNKGTIMNRKDGFNLWVYIIIMAFLLGGVVTSCSTFIGFGGNPVVNNVDYISNSFTYNKYGIHVDNHEAMFRDSKASDMFLKYADWITEFLETAKANGFDVSHVYNQRFSIYEVDEAEGTRNDIGRSYGRNKDYVTIFLYKEKFFAEGRTDLDRKFILWHELAHDILNVGHIPQYGNLMSPNGGKIGRSQIFFENSVFKMFKSIRNGQLK